MPDWSDALRKVTAGLCRQNTLSPFGSWDAECGEAAFEFSAAHAPCRDFEAEDEAALRAADESFDAGEFSGALTRDEEARVPCGKDRGLAAGA